MRDRRATNSQKVVKELAVATKHARRILSQSCLRTDPLRVQASETEPVANAAYPQGRPQSIRPVRQAAANCLTSTCTPTRSAAALEYGNDWFVVPVELSVGVLCQIRSLIVTNTFGERLLIPHASEVDGDTSPWQMFAISEDSRHVFVLPPVLGPSLQSAPIEDVLFLRDEMANVAWAVERVVESPAGRPLDRFEAFQESRRGKEREEDSAPAGRPDGTIAYRLGTSVPDYWIPLLPVRHGTSIRLKRGVLPQSGAEGAAVISKPQGKVLEPDRDLLLHDEEVPREGARVTRSFQYARWIDGSTHLWIGRRKQPGRGEGSSGLQFDVAAHGALHDSNVRPPGS